MCCTRHFQKYFPLSLSSVLFPLYEARITLGRGFTLDLTVLPPCMWQQNLFLGAEETTWEDCVRSQAFTWITELRSRARAWTPGGGKGRGGWQRIGGHLSIPCQWRFKAERAEKGAHVCHEGFMGPEGKTSLCPFPPRGFLQGESRKNPKTELPWP